MIRKRVTFINERGEAYKINKRILELSFIGLCSFVIILALVVKLYINEKKNTVALNEVIKNKDIEIKMNIEDMQSFKNQTKELEGKITTLEESIKTLKNQ